MSNWATSAYVTTNAAKYRGLGLGPSRLRAILISTLAAMADKRNSTTYFTDSAALRRDVEAIVFDNDEHRMAAWIAMQVGQDGAIGGGSSVAAGASLTTLLEASKTIALWDEKTQWDAIAILLGQQTIIGVP